jgi:hypothetical protein
MVDSLLARPPPTLAVTRPLPLKALDGTLDAPDPRLACTGRGQARMYYRPPAALA